MTKKKAEEVKETGADSSGSFEGSAFGGDGDVIKRKISKNGEWAGNGSGVIISKSGHIITNHHVIKDAEDIEVEFMLNDELQKFNAEVVQVDKTNDLAVLKIFDMNKEKNWKIY